MIQSPTQKYPLWESNEVKIIFKIPGYNCCGRPTFLLCKLENHLQIIPSVKLCFASVRFKIYPQIMFFCIENNSTYFTLFLAYLSNICKGNPNIFLTLQRSFLLYLCERISGAEKNKKRWFISHNLFLGTEM